MKCEGNNFEKGCKKSFNVNGSLIIKLCHYIEPYGPCHMSGGYWEGKFFSSCPNCGVLNECYPKKSYIAFYKNNYGIIDYPPMYSTEVNGGGLWISASKIEKNVYKNLKGK